VDAICEANGQRIDRESRWIMSPSCGHLPSLNEPELPKSIFVYYGYLIVGLEFSKQDCRRLQGRKEIVGFWEIARVWWSWCSWLAILELQLKAAPTRTRLGQGKARHVITILSYHHVIDMQGLELMA
jgi:hypothetical protein